MLIITGEIRSVKIGGHRRVLPQWVDEYVARVAEDPLSLAVRGPTARARSSRIATATPAYAWVPKPNGLRARKYVYGKTREDVHDKWIKLQRARQGPVPTRVPTVAAYVTNWLEDVVRPNLAPTTSAKYETFSRLYIVPGIGAKRLDRLQVRDVQTWLNRVRATCQCCAQGKDARRPEDAAMLCP
jgi:hypothetical protein